MPVHFRIKHGRHKIIGQSAGAAEVNMVHTYSNCLGGYFYVLLPKFTAHLRKPVGQ